MKRRSASFVPGSLVAVGCDDQPPAGPQYYERVIQPILTQNCVFNQGACHKDDGNGNALGNLDLTSYANTTRRRDVLRTYGSYPGAAAPAQGVGRDGAADSRTKARTDGTTKFFTSEIQHAGGATLSVDVVRRSSSCRSGWPTAPPRTARWCTKAQQMGTGACNPTS